MMNNTQTINDNDIIDRMKTKGYKYMVQIETAIGDFGKPLFFKHSTEIGPFLRSFPDSDNAKLKWISMIDSNTNWIEFVSNS